MADFNISVLKVRPWEVADVNKPYTNDPQDPGGETCWGVTLRTLRSHPECSSWDIKTLTWDPQACWVYKKEFWFCDGIESQALADKLLNTAVNIGPAKVIRWLQQLAGVAVDGNFGAATLAAVNGKDPQVLIDGIRQLQAARYNAIIAAKPALEKYRKGWMRRAAS